MASATVSMLHWGCMIVLLVAFSSVRDCNAQACGGNFTDLRGAITSPFYPNGYSNNMECVYIIKAPTGYRITLSFLDFFLEAHVSCSYDFVEVYDGGDVTCPLLGYQFCGNTLPPVQRTSQNVMLIRFKTDGSTTYRGFNASYTSACGGTFTALEGAITSPFYPNNYTNDLDCIYVIRAPTGYRITLSFHDFSLQASDSCEYDNLKIYDGEFLNSSVIGDYLCTVTLPYDVRTTGDRMLIQFKTDNSVTDIGFSASYIAACGENFTALEGVITSPFYPNYYTNDLDCKYIIRAPTGYRITLSFHDLSLEASDSCKFDNLTIYDGEFLNSLLIGDYLCTVTLPYDVRTTGDSMLIQFKTDNSVTDRGFSASYITKIIPQEFMLVTTSRGEIVRVEIHTKSVVKVPVVGLKKPFGIHYDPVDDRMYWTDISLIEIRSAFLNGSDNKLVRYVGPGKTSGTLDGITLDTQSRLIFYTDAGNQVIGLITISTYQHKYVINDNLDKPRAIVLDCLKGIIFWTDWGQNARIERANYDGSDRTVIVRTDIVQPNGLVLDASRNHLYWADSGTHRVERTDTAGLDRTKIREGTNEMFFSLALNDDKLYVIRWPPAGSYTSTSYVDGMNIDGTDISDLIYTTNIRINGIYVYSPISTGTGPNGCSNGQGGCSHICILSSGNNTKCMCPSGQYLSDDQKTCLSEACGGTFTALEGAITSPFYPNNYTNDLDCIYVIRAPTGYRITLSFHDFSLQASDSCEYDNLKIYDGEFLNSSVIGDYLCTVTLPYDVRTTGDRMLIQFKTDNSVTDIGFSASYIAACGENFTALEGVITSPFYPNYYTNDLDCKYIIRAPTGYRITLSFHDLSLEASDSCKFDNLTIYDGEFLNSLLIGDYLCTVTLPYDVRTTGDSMLIQFKTDNSVTDRGFSASYITKIIPQEFMLMTTSKGEIYRVEIHTKSVVKVPVVGLKKPFGIHYDPVDDRMYWTDISLIEIRSAFLNGSDNKLVRYVGPGKTSGTLDGITLDTQSRLIFYTDAGNQVIGLINISTYQHKYVINDNLDKPRAIVLDCLKGIIFWTDWGQNARIERANYDGSDRKVIVRTDIVQPNGLALDASRNHLYWADSGTHRVERTDTAGLDRTKIREGTNEMFFSLALNDDKLYVIRWPPAGSYTSTSYVDGMNIDGTDISDLIYTTNIRINGIYVYSPISTGTGTETSLNYPLIGGAAGGGLVLILLIIVIIVCVKRRRDMSSNDRPRPRPHDSRETEGPNVTSSNEFQNGENGRDNIYNEINHTHEETAESINMANMGAMVNGGYLHPTYNLQPSSINYDDSVSDYIHPI